MRAPSDLTNRIRRRLQALRKRTRHRLGWPTSAQTPAKLCKAFSHPIDSRTRSQLLSRYRELFPEAVRTELSEARRLAAHNFRLLGHEMAHGDTIAWSRDPVSGRDWSRGFSPDIQYRGDERLGDIKLPWELNKHQYFFTLGKAAWLTGDSSTAAEIVRQIDSWIEDNPCDHGIHWISALESGTRAISWIMSFPFYAEACDESFLRRMTLSLAQHLRFVDEHLSTGRYTNTHLVGEATALVAGGLFLDCRYSDKWLSTGLSILELEMQRQVTPDGVHAERSVAYHRFFLDHYYLASSLLAANGRSLSSETHLQMERMTGFLQDAVVHGQTSPSFGDCDDARGLWMRADCPTEYRSLLALGAEMFGRPDFKMVAGGPTEELLWLKGDRGIANFSQLHEALPDHTSTCYPVAGYFVMRGGWEAADPVLLFDCGPLGHGPAGHGHADALSVQLWAHGFPFLVDAGTFSYNLDYRWRDAFRSTAAHNTIEIDHQNQSIPQDRMSWKTKAVARSNRWVTNKYFDLVDGEHDGYQRLPDPVSHRRIVVYFKPDMWVVCDCLSGMVPHHFSHSLHVRPDCTVRIHNGTNGAILEAPNCSRLHVFCMDASTGAPVSPEVVTASEVESAAWFSPEYGRRIESRMLAIRREFVGRYALITAFTTTDRRALSCSEQNGVIRLELRSSCNDVETLYFNVEDKASWDFDGIRFDGVLLFKRVDASGFSTLLATQFHELVVPNLVELKSQEVVESMEFENDLLKLVLRDSNAAGLSVQTRDGVAVRINGRPLACQFKSS
jgi:hypothetical protein